MTRAEIGDYLQRHATRLSLACDESLPRLGALVNDFLGISVTIVSEYSYVLT